MSYELRKESGLTIVGFSARVSPDAPHRIGELWSTFQGAGGLQSIDGRLDDAVYSVYCDYEGDYTKPYTAVVGCAVDPSVMTTTDRTKVEVFPGKFAVFKVEGELPGAIFDTWFEIWSTPLKRTYQADFDRYGVDGSVTIHVGLRAD